MRKRKAPEWIYGEMMKARLTSAEIAARAGVSGRMVRHVIRGTKKSRRVMEMVAVMLGRPFEQVWGSPPAVSSWQLAVGWEGGGDEHLRNLSRADSRGRGAGPGGPGPAALLLPGGPAGGAGGPGAGPRGDFAGPETPGPDA